VKVPGRLPDRLDERSPAASYSSGTGIVKGNDSSALMKSQLMSARVGRAGLERVRDSLSKRELGIVSTLGQHRYLSTRQIEAFHFSDHATQLTGARICRRVLARLTDERVLERLERRAIGGVYAGSASYLYTLGPIGWRLLGEGSRSRSREPSEIFLDHTLAVADLHIALVEAERRGEIELIQVEIEYACWRRYLGTGGSLERLRPDLYVVTASGDFEHCWFVEVDLASESLTTVVRKCRQYTAYRQTGVEQRKTGTYPIVIWSVPTSKRRERIARAIGGAKRLPQELFRVVEAGGLVSVLAGGTV
jgi:hypothetical protein